MTEQAAARPAAARGRRGRWGLPVAVTLLAVVVGCSSAVSGAGSPAPSGPATPSASTAAGSTPAGSTPAVTTSSSPASTVPTRPGSTTPTSSGPATSTPASAPSTPTSAAGHRFPLCPRTRETDIAALADCVHDDLVEFWERETKATIDRPVVIEPRFPPQPQECEAPQSIYAYYCTTNRTIYVNTSLLELWDDEFTRAEVPYSLAVTLAHEVGHAAQYALDPAAGAASSRTVELQADCLAGVWARQVIDTDDVDRAVLLRVWRHETELLNTPEHQRTHGTPDQRLAATRRGISGGDPAACGLADS